MRAKQKHEARNKEQIKYPRETLENTRITKVRNIEG